MKWKRVAVVLAVAVAGFLAGRIGYKLFLNALVGGVLF